MIVDHMGDEPLSGRGGALLHHRPPKNLSCDFHRTVLKPGMTHLPALGSSRYEPFAKLDVSSLCC